MTSKSAYFKAIARNALRGKWQKMAWIVFIGTLISGGIQLDAGEIKPNFQLNFNMLDKNVVSMLLIGICVCLFLALLVGSVVNVGLYNLSGRLIDGEEPRMRMLFPRRVAWRAVFMNILRALIVYGVLIIVVAAAAVTQNITVLTVGISISYVPAFFLSYCYAMADYLLLTNPGMGPMRALKESRHRMKGFKSDLFWLELSFIGWSLLSMVPQLVLMSLLVDLSTQAAIVAGFAASIVCSAFVSVYQVVAKTAFFRDVDNPDDGYARRRAAQQEYAQRMYEQATNTQTQPQEEDAPQVPSAVVDEDAARNLFLDYKCSRSAMHEAGVLEEYEAMGVDSSMETRWMREYADLLIRRFDRDALALEDILRFAAEHAHEELLDRAVMRVDRHVRQQSLPADEILGMLGRIAALLKSGVYDENPGYIQRRTEQLGEILGRIEQTDPDSAMVQTIRAML